MKFCLILLLVTFNKTDLVISKITVDKDNVAFSVTNKDTIPQYVNIQLEKKINSNWVLYSKDVFSRPFSKSELTKKIEFNDNIFYSIIIDTPEWINMPNKKIDIQKCKKGNFRLKVLYGKDEFDKGKTVYSKPFYIK